MLDIRPIGIEDYAERHSKPLSALHHKLWMETYSKTRHPAMMVGALEGFDGPVLRIHKQHGVHSVRAVVVALVALLVHRLSNGTDLDRNSWRSHEFAHPERPALRVVGDVREEEPGVGSIFEPDPPLYPSHPHTYCGVA